MKKSMFAPGTLVLKTSTGEPRYGVVIGKKIWLTCVRQKNPEEAENFEKSETGSNLSSIPVFLFGRNNIGTKMEKDSKGNVFESLYYQRFTYSNVGGDIMIIDGVKNLLSTLSQMLLFYGKIKTYPEEVKLDVEIFADYLKGIAPLDNTSYRTELFKTYQAVLPDLFGSQK